MTNDEMIRWAGLEKDEKLEALIWIARNEERARMMKWLRDLAQMEMDVALLSSYPGGLRGANKK